MMTPDIETEDYFGLTPNAVQEIMHRDKQALVDAVQRVQDMMPEADGQDWSFKAFHYLTAINILLQAINEQIK